MLIKNKQLRTTVNFTCKQTLLRLMPAVPVVKALLIEEALRNDCDPSIPTTDPLMVLLTGPRLNTNSLLKVSLKEKEVIYQLKYHTKSTNHQTVS